MILRTLAETDAPAMLEWMHDPKVQKSFGKNFNSMKIEDCQRFIAQNRHHETDDLNMAISTDDGAYAGTVSLKHINHDNKSAEFAIVVHPGYQGRGFGLQAMEQIGQIGFKDLGLQTIYLNVKKSNAAANALYKKFGCIETSEAALREKGITLFLPETEEEMNWYLFNN